MHEYRRDSRFYRVVIVEPHADSRDMYSQYFRRVGVQVSAVSTAADALSILRREARAAIITCLRLPGMDGFELCDALQALPHASGIPVIAIGSCLADFQRAVGGNRFATVLMKPCRPDVLLDSLRGVLAVSRSGVTRRRSRLLESPGSRIPA